MVLATQDHRHSAGFIEPEYSCVRLFTNGRYKSSLMLQYVQYVSGIVASSCIMACIVASILAVSRHVL